MSTKMSPAMRRYTIRLLAVMGLYGVALVGANAWFRHAQPEGLLAYLIAALPALPIIGVFVVIGRLLIELEDEYVRMLLVRQSLVATAFALSVMTVLGFLDDFGVGPQLNNYHAAVLWFSGLGIGGCVNWLLESRRAK